MSDEQEPKISEQQWFAMLLEHAVSMASHILDEVDEVNLDKSNVTLSADFVIDLLDCVIEYACRYEDFGKNMEEMLAMYRQQAERQVKFGRRTVH